LIGSASGDSSADAFRTSWIITAGDFRETAWSLYDAARFNREFRTLMPPALDGVERRGASHERRDGPDRSSPVTPPRAPIANLRTKSMALTTTCFTVDSQPA
jgi:hypothetical protein